MQTAEGKKRRVYALLAIVLLALALRLAFSFVLYPRLAGPLGLGQDPDYFGQLALNWATGQGYVFYPGDPPSTFRGPGYPVLLAAIYLLSGQLLPATALVQSLIGALLCLPVFAIGRRVGGARVGYLAAGACALYPLLIWYTPRLQYEPLFTLLLALAVLWTMKVGVDAPLAAAAAAQQSAATRQWLWPAALLGFWWGAAALINQAVLLLPLPLFGMSMLAGKARVQNAKFRMQKWAVALVVMASVIAPWAIRNYWVSGRFIPVHSGGVTQFVKGNLEFEHYQEAPLQSTRLARLAEDRLAQMLALSAEAGTPHPATAEPLDVRSEGLDQALWPHAVEFLRRQPGRLLAKVLAQAPRFWYLSETALKSRALAVLQLPLLLLAAIGLILGLRPPRQAWPALRVLLVAVLYFNLVYAALHVEGRYSTPVIPFVIVLAASGVVSIVDRVVHG